ncbi:glycosyltransferase [Candidatus Saccharibacteria bacterium]|nr:glycosyltransferase [Candidatus Saccharibacteria bacterium]
MTSRQPLITVAVAVYNIEKYVGKCIDSIISQKYRNLEIILVNDGSTDKSGLVCDEYAKKDKRIAVIHQKNGGLSSARNAGIKAAKGEYIAFVDGDDYVDENYISALYDAITEKKADIAIAGHTIIYPNKSIEKKSSESLLLAPEDALREILYDRNIDISSWGKLYKKELFANISFPDGQLFEDSATTYKLFIAAKQIVVIPESHYSYFIREGSITNTGFSRKKLDLLKSTKDMADDIVALYPDLKQAAERRLMWAHLSTLAVMASSKNVPASDRKMVFSYIRANRASVLKDPNIQKRDRMSLYISYFGYRFFKLFWNAYKRGRK